MLFDHLDPGFHSRLGESWMRNVWNLHFRLPHHEGLTSVSLLQVIS